MKPKQKFPVECSIKRYSKSSLLGKGNFGQVFIATQVNTGETVAIKRVKKIQNSQQGLSVNFLKELSILKKLKHPKIIKCFGYSVTESQTDAFFILEYMSTDLEKQLLKSKLTQDQITKMLRDILSALQYCHSQNIAHRDIKPSNILINVDNFEAKLTDFGISKQLFCNPKPNTTKIAALYYRAPELLLENNNYSYSIDLWGVGCIFAEAFLGKRLFEGEFSTDLSQLYNIVKSLSILNDLRSLHQIQTINQLKQQCSKIAQRPIQQAYPELRLQIPEQGLDLLNKMISFDPRRRITAKEALNHPFLKTQL